MDQAEYERGREELRAMLRRSWDHMPKPDFIDMIFPRVEEIEPFKQQVKAWEVLQERWRGDLDR